MAKNNKGIKARLGEKGQNENDIQPFPSFVLLADPSLLFHELDHLLFITALQMQPVLSGG